MGVNCLFASDLHGNEKRCRSLLRVVADERPAVVLLGGDLLPAFHGSRGGAEGFVDGFLLPEMSRLADRLGAGWPRMFFIFGNDDQRSMEPLLEGGEEQGLWQGVHGKWVELDSFRIAGYSYVPPTPFLLKDWERYDVSRYVDPGCVSPEEGYRSVSVDADEPRFRTIADDLASLCAGVDAERAVLLCHSPPYGSLLDRAALDGQKIDHVPLDVHVGSIALQRHIESWQPLLTLHGHVHESTRLTGAWRQKLGRTHAFNAAHDGPELALIRFDLDDLDNATRELI